jgi:hypothetical protein
MTFRLFHCAHLFSAQGRSMFRNPGNSRLGALQRGCGSLRPHDFSSPQIARRKRPSPAARDIAWLNVILLLLGSVFPVLTGCRAGTQHNSEPIISFTQVPQSSRGDENLQDVMEGTVTGARQGQRLVIYAKMDNLWWVQPLVNSPFTSILSDRVWRNEVHLGTDYAVLLVDPSYDPAPVLAQLPDRGQGVSAIGVSHGSKTSSSFFVDFSGFRWRVRKVPSDRGSTLNPYSPDNVYTDQSGALHLRIIKRGQRWTCSEVNLTRSLGYGTYSFAVEDTSRLEPAVVFSIYTWDYSTKQDNYGEVDINMTRWGDPTAHNAEFVIQPPVVPANISRFMAPAGRLRHTIVWEPGRVTMVTAPASAEAGASVVSQHLFTSEVPVPGVESIRMALYVYRNPNGETPDLQHPAEVVVDDFQYKP